MFVLTVVVVWISGMDVHQRAADSLIFRLIADRIQSLVDRLAMRWRSADSYLAAKKMVMVELELLREKVDRYPELEQIRR